VVELGSARGGVEDSGSVSLEGSSVGFDGDGGWSLSDGGEESVGRSGLDVVDRSNVNLSLVVSSFASSVSGSVGVVRLENLSVGLDVLHTIGLPSTSASIALSVAVNELLFGKGDEVSGLDGVVSFDGAGGGESPA